MKPEMILKADVLDILFEGRNKEYGAYALRKNYDRRMYIALGSMLMVVLTFVLLNYSFGNKPGTYYSSTEFVIDTLQLADLPPKKPEPPKPVEPPKKMEVSMVQHTTPVLIDKVDVPPPTVEDMDKDVLIGTENKKGIPASGAPGVSEGNGNAPPAPVETKRGTDRGDD